MASGLTMSRFRHTKQCVSCTKSMHEADGHDLCIKCLTPSHDMGECSICCAFPFPLVKTRNEIIDDVLSNGVWPIDWEVKLASTENVVFGSIHTIATSNLAASLESTGKTGKEGHEVQTLKKQVTPSRSIASPTAASSQQTEKAKPAAKKPSKAQQDAQWKEEVNSALSFISEYIKKQEAKKEARKGKGKGKRSKKVSDSSSDTDVGSQEVSREPEVHRLEEHPPKKKARHEVPTKRVPVATLPNPDTDQSVLSLTLGPEFATQPPPPQFSIPRKHFSDLASSKDSDSQEDDDEEEVSSIGRGDRRKLYLQGLRNLVPQLKHPDLPKAPVSGHFSLLMPKQKETVMPFLPQVFEQVTRSAKRSEKKKVNVPKKVAKFYSTTEPAESGILQPRYVPRELLQFVPASKLSDAGVSGVGARLKSTTPEGAKEMASLESHDHAATYIRVMNNLEIGVEANTTLIQRASKSVGKLAAMPDIPDQAQIYIAELQRSVNLMKQTVDDMKSSSNDLLQIALSQYTGSLNARRDAWLAAAQVPQALRNEVKNSDHVQPSEFDEKAKKLSLLGPEATQCLTEYIQIKKDSLLLGQPAVVDPQTAWPWYATNRGRQSSRGVRGARGGRARRRGSGRQWGNTSSTRFQRGKKKQPFQQAKPPPKQD